MNMLYLLSSLVMFVGSVFAAVPVQTTQLADVETTTWYLIAAGFLAELAIMYILLSARESFAKIFGVTVFMNLVSIFMSSVAVFGVDAFGILLGVPGNILFVLSYLVSIAASVFSEVLIVQKIFPSVDRAKLIAWLTLANIVSIGAGMYGVWMTRF